MDWPVLVLVAIAIALAGIGVWWWLQRRGLADAAPDEAPTATEPVAIPVGEPDSAPVAGEPEPAPIAVAASAMPLQATATTTFTKVAAATAAKPSAAEAAKPSAVDDAPATTASGPAPERITRSDDPAHPFGPGSAAPRADGGGPKGWTVKGNADSGLYHTPSSPSWKRLKAEAWFEDEAAAEAAGFTRWDWRRSAS